MTLLQEIVAKKKEWQAKNCTGLSPTITMSQMMYEALFREMVTYNKFYYGEKTDACIEEIAGMKIKVVDGITI